MRVGGTTLTGMEISAGLAAMVGQFTAREVERAMRNAGAGDEAYRAADRLLQSERKAGNIRHIGRGRWKCGK